MRFSTPRLAVVLSSCLVACYAELPGSAPVEDSSLVEAGDGGLGGGFDTGLSPRDAGGADVGAHPGVSCGSLPDGEMQTRQRYPAKTVTNASACTLEEQTRTCTGGTLSEWSGSATFDTCEVAFMGTCNPFSMVPCEPQTTCVFRTASSVCLGSPGRTCTANAECQHTCVGGSCTPARVPRGGSCDDVGDCVACAGSSISCSQGVCMCGAGGSCSANDQCEGTCVASKCIDANTSCDKDDDCRDAYKCSKPTGNAVGTCLLPNQQPCTSNAQCINVCRPRDDQENPTQKQCSQPGRVDSHCDDNEDCEQGLVCRTLDGGLHCAAAGGPLAVCDEDEDCAAPLSCSSSGSGGDSVCFVGGGGGGD